MKNLSEERDLFGDSRKEKNNSILRITPDLEIKSAETAITRLESTGHKINDYAKSILKDVDWSDKIGEGYNIVSMSAEDIMGKDNAGAEGSFILRKKYLLGEIIKKAKEISLDLVPGALVPEIILNYNGDERTTIAMKPIKSSFGQILFNCGKSNSGIWLGYTNGNPNEKWDASEKFYFVKK